MTLQSKPIQDHISSNALAVLGSWYISALQSQPLLTKALTSGILSGVGNTIGQILQGAPTLIPFNCRSLLAFSAYGCLIQAPITHFWLNYLERNGPRNSLLKLFVDRFIYGPMILLLTLYLLAVFQGTGNRQALLNIKKNYPTALKANLKLWVICQYVNLNFVPLQYRTLVTNLIALVWNIYLSTKQRIAANKSAAGTD